VTVLLQVRPRCLLQPYARWAVCVRFAMASGSPHPQHAVVRRLRTLSKQLGGAPVRAGAATVEPSVPGDTEATPVQFAEVAASIRSDLAAHALPSLAVAVARGGEVLWETGFGWADREARREATAHTSYSLASISKPVTATGLAILVERGLVDLDAPIDDYIGAAKLNPGAARAVSASGADGATVRRVGNHTSGLPLHFQFFYEDQEFERPPFEETILRYANLVTPPGTHYQYSNLGYGLLDHVIKNVRYKHKHAQPEQTDRVRFGSTCYTSRIIFTKKARDKYRGNSNPPTRFIITAVAATQTLCERRSFNPSVRACNAMQCSMG
jgi:hypothetical protein